MLYNRGMARRAAAIAIFSLCAATAALAQRGFRGDFGGFGDFGFHREPVIHNIPYDGRFTFVRLKYTTAPGGYW